MVAQGADNTTTHPALRAPTISELCQELGGTGDGEGAGHAAWTLASNHAARSARWLGRRRGLSDAVAESLYGRNAASLALIAGRANCTNLATA